MNTNPSTSWRIALSLRECSRVAIAALIARAATAVLSAQTPSAASAATDSGSAQSQSETPVTMNPLEITAGSSNGYRSQSTYTADGVMRNYLDVPQAVDVVTTQFLQDFGITDNRNAMETVAGVQLGPNANGAVFNIRGVETNTLYVDGMQSQAKSSASFNGQFIMPTVFYDRIEVVKGPSSAEFALGEAGGAINYVSKTPQGVDRTDLQFGVGTYNNYSASLDQQGQSGKLGYRFIFDREAGDNEVKYLHTEMTGGQLALAYQATPTTTVNWITQVENSLVPAYNPWTQFHDSTAAQFKNFIAIPGFVYNPAAAALPASPPEGYVSNSDNGAINGYSFYQNQFFRSFANIVQVINEHLSIRDTVQIDDDVNTSQLPVWSAALVANQPTAGAYALQASVQNISTHSRGFRDALTLRGQYAILGGDWTTLVGGDVGEGWWSDLPGAVNGALKTAAGTPLYVDYTTGDMVNVNSLIGPTSLAVFDQTSFKRDSYSMFAQEELSYFSGLVSVVGGWRKDFLSDTNIAYFNPTQSYARGWAHTSGSPRVSLSIKPTNWLSFYSLYSVHNEPTQSASKYGAVTTVPLSVLPDKFALQNYTPRGTDLEGGIKANLLDGKLTATASVYHATTSGTLLIVPENLSFIDTTGIAQTQIPVQQVVGENIHGFEVEVVGQLAKRLEISASYSNTRGTVPATVAGATSKGTLTIPVVNPVHPPDTIDIFAKLDLGAPIGTGFYVTAGGTFFGPAPYGAPLLDYSGVIHQLQYPSWQYIATAGIGFRWAHGKQSLFLSCHNLTDRYVDILPINFKNPAVDTGRTTWLKYSIRL